MTSTAYDRWTTGTWLLELRGEPLELRYVASLILENAPLELVEVEGRFYLTSSRFSSCQNAREVLASGRELVEALYGALALKNLRFSMQIGTVAKTQLGKPPTQTIIHECISSTNKFGICTLSVGDSPVSPNPLALHLSACLSLAMDSFSAHYALRLVSAEHPTWIDLYKAVELVEQEVDNLATLQVDNWCSMLKRFKQTANTFSAVKEDARHAQMSWAKPRNQMTPDEATAFVRNLVAKWLQSK